MLGSASVCRKICPCVSFTTERKFSFSLAEAERERLFQERTKTKCCCILLSLLLARRRVHSMANTAWRTSFEQSGCTFSVDSDCICYKYRLFAYRKLIWAPEVEMKDSKSEITGSVKGITGRIFCCGETAQQ